VSLASANSYHSPYRHTSKPLVIMSPEPPTNLPLPQFYARTLTSLVPLFDDVLSPSSPGAQDLLRTALDELYLIARMIVSLGVFSENESAEELGDGELVFMTLGWVIGEAEAKAGLGGMEDRKGALQRSEVGRVESHPQSIPIP
jgi:immunoglobulin-binding protein 1